MMAAEGSASERRAEIRRAVGEAESEAVVQGLRRCIDRFPSRHWLAPESVCRSNPGQFLRSTSGEQLLERREDLADFAAASTILHCSDSWTLLGDASLCLISGNLAQAVHLTYYAELRAALALMSATGVLVVNDMSVAVGTHSVRTIKPGSSHDLLWQVFAEWCTSAEAQDFIGHTLRFHKMPMTRWISAAQRGGSGVPAVAELLQRWGVDLKRVTADRDMRNLASYNPSFLFEERGIEYGRWARGVTADVAALVEPASGGFPLLDNALFSTVLAMVAPDDEQAFRIIRDVFASDYEARRVFDLIVELRETGPTLIDMASRESDPEALEPKVAESMLGRALILARLATGVAQQLQRRAGADIAQFAWWTDEIAIRQGFWCPPERPDELLNMWADVEVGITDLRAVEFTDSSGVHAVRDQTPDGMLAATGLGRVAVWSLSA